ncbi:MAG: hypothetical protein ACM3PY_08590 [Omnitrophica WOR_2 bacterium]
MSSLFYNYRHILASNSWERHDFRNHWWRLYQDDPNWVPPFYSIFKKETRLSFNSHLARMDPIFYYSQAVLKRPPSQKSAPASANSDNFYISPFIEQTVSTSIGLHNPKQTRLSAYLALVKVANDVEALERLIQVLGKELKTKGCRQIIAPTGLSPHLSSGILLDCWDRLPPSHTAYNPPYIPDIFNAVMQPYVTSRLYRMDLAGAYTPETGENKGEHPNICFEPFEYNRLNADLSDLFQSAIPPESGFPFPDGDEIAFILRSISNCPVIGQLALIEQQPVGFFLLQPDVSPVLHHCMGAKNIWWRPWLQWMVKRSARDGRLLFGGVEPEWRKKGVGHLLLMQAIMAAQKQGWKSLYIGPVPERAEASSFLIHHGAKPEQTYQVYRLEIK